MTAISASRKLPGMHILMAIVTELMCQLLFEIAGDVTLLTLDIPMFTTQRKVCQIVIECASGNCPPIFSRMTLCALLTKAAMMRILMTWNTIGKWQTGILNKNSNCFSADFFRRRLFRMTFGTRHVFVLAGEQKLGTIVRKFCSRPPSREIMTSFTGVVELIAMLVRVTGNAFLRKPKKSFGRAHVGIARKFFLNILELMAVATRHACMLARQHIFRLFMVEVRLTFFPKDQRKIQAIMLAVAGGAGL